MPLGLHDCCFRPTGAAHPGIDLVFDAVVIRRAEQQFAHPIPTSAGHAAAPGNAPIRAGTARHP